jgi:acetyl esterase/lipase
VSRPHIKCRSSRFIYFSRWRTKFLTSFQHGKTDFDAILKVVTLHIPSRSQNLTLRLHTPAKNTKPLGSPPHEPTALFPVLLWFADGGFVFGVNGHDDYKCKEIANQTEHIVINVEVRLAPEFPFPHAINDGVYALYWIMNSIDKYGGDPNRIHMAGSF